MQYRATVTSAIAVGIVPVQAKLLRLRGLPVQWPPKKLVANLPTDEPTAEELLSCLQAYELRVDHSSRLPALGEISTPRGG